MPDTLKARYEAARKAREEAEKRKANNAKAYPGSFGTVSNDTSTRRTPPKQQESGDYEPITSEPIRTPDKMVREQRERVKAEKAREEEIERRRQEVIAEAKRQAAERKRKEFEARNRTTPEEDERRIARPRTFSSVPDDIIESDVAPRTLTVDDVETPVEEAVAKIPSQMDLEARILASPLSQRALTRSRTEELVSKGMPEEEAAAQAKREQAERAAAFNQGRSVIEANEGAFNKESRGFTSGLGQSFLAPAARLVGYGHVADKIEAAKAGMQAELEGYREHNYPYPNVMGATSAAIDSMAQMVPGMAASAIGGPTTGLAVMAAQYGGQEYSQAAYEAAEAGLAGKERDTYALLQGGIEAMIMPIMSKIPGMAGLEGRVLKQSIARGMMQRVLAHPTWKGLVGGAKKFTKDAVAEAAEEVITEASHGVARQELLDERVDFKKTIADTILQTMVMMGAVESAQQVGNAANRWMQSKAATDFVEQPSRKKYEAAVKAGMPPIEDGKSSEGRAKYAEELRNQQAAPPVEAPSGTVSDDEEMARYIKDLEGGDPNEEAISQAQPAPAQGVQEGQQGRQEGLLSQPQAVRPGGPLQERQLEQPEAVETPSGIDGMTAPAVPNESVQPGASPDRAAFEQEYRDTFEQIYQSGADSPEAAVYKARLHEMASSRPDWADEIESTIAQPQSQTPPVVASGGTSPDQPAPSQAGPVSETAVPEQPAVSGKRADVPMWGIYPTLFHGKPKFAVKEYEKGFGDALFDSESEAKEYADTGRQRAAENAAREARRQAAEEADQKKQQEHEASFQGFLTDDPKTKGRRLKTLDSALNYKNKPTTRKELIEQKIADGWTVNDKDQLQAPTGEFLDERDLTKTGIDYARHVVNLKQQTTPQAVPWRRQAGEERADYNRKLKKEGWTQSPKPSIAVIDSPDRVKALSLEQQKTSPYKKGDRVIVHTGFSTDEMQIGGEVLEDSLPESPSVKVRVDSGKVHYVSAYYTQKDTKTVEIDQNTESVTPHPWKDATVEDEDRWFGTTVTVNPPSKRDKPYKGTVVRVLNKGELVEVRPLRNKNGESFRVKSSAIVVDELVDNRTVKSTAQDKPNEQPTEKTRSGQTLLPGMTGRAEEIDRNEFVRKHTSRLNDEVSDIVPDDADREKMLEPFGNIMKAVWNGSVMSADELFNDDIGNGLWTAFEALVEYHSPYRRSARVLNAAEQAIQRAIADSDALREASKKHGEAAPQKMESQPSAGDAVATDDDIKAAIRAEKKRREEEKAAQQKPVSENRATPEILRERISDADNYAQIVKSVGDDAANDLFVKLTDPEALAKRPSLLKYDPDKPFVPWAVMVARNLKKDAEAKARKALGEPLADEESIPEKKKRSGLGEKTAELSAKTGERRKKVIEDALKKLNDMEILTGPGVNMKAVGIVVDMAEALITDGVVKFADFIVAVVEVAGEATTRKLSRYLEMAWDVSRETNPELDPAGKVADVLGAEGVTTNGDKSNGKPEDGATTPDASMGGMSGESGRTLAPETGGTPEGGNAETDAGSDSENVSGRTDSTAESEPGSAGAVSSGTGAEQGTGAKPESGRNPTVRGSRKPAERIPRNVEGPRNLRIQEDDTIAPRGVVSKLKANIAAIKLLKELQGNNRQATESEQRVLMQYTGWGSLPQVFDKNRGDAYIAKPGLEDRYGAEYRKAQLYEVEGKYSTLEEIRERVESWEKQWGESYKYLKETLTKDEWNKAAASVLNAHFTSRDVITNGIWGALERMGVTGGRFLEPSSGIGSLIGLMPEGIANNAEVVAIELDSLTGDMVKQLYPEADVHVKGFEEVPIPAGTVDIAATNVPFHQKGPADAKTRYGREMNLHNYFIARILDSLRPGGIAAVISTHFTMDANPQDRALLASKADLVGAIRLPNTAFKANAGTEVTTDIMFFRKPDGSPFKGEPWQNLATVGTYLYMKRKTKKGPLVQHEGNIAVNEYFAAHPEMVLGTHSMEGKQYSDTEYTVMPVSGEELADQLKKAVANLPAAIATTDNAPMMPSMETGTSGVEGRIDFRGGKLQELSKGEWVAPEWLKNEILLTKKGEPRKLKEETKNKKIAEAVTQGIAYTKVRNAYESHVAIMRNKEATKEEYEASQKALNVAYDAYFAKHGALNASGSGWLERDPGFFATAGLEVEVELIENGVDRMVYAKSDVFTKRTVSPTVVPTTADTTEEAVKLSLAWRGSLNLPWMSELTGRTEDDLRTELLDSGLVFQDPETSLLEPADTYLSGNVHAKLRNAEQAVANGDKRFEKNVDALKAVQPPLVTIDSITPGIDQEWIPPAVVQQWLSDVVGLPYAEVKYHENADVWSVSTGGVPRDVQNTWATNGMHLSDLLPKVLNGSTLRVMKDEAYTDENGRVKTKKVEDQAQTQAAQVKAEKIRDSFEKWAKTNEQAIPLIEKAFNEQKNFYVKPKYNGQHLTFPGMSEKWLRWMRPYQKNTIWRFIREGRGMIAHGVGAGKTLELIAIAMEMKRLGTATKPLLVVQNSTLGQFARTFTEVYPAAKVLVARPEDLKPDNRAKFMARVVTGNWDAIVMAKSTFNEKLPNDPSREEALIEGMIEELTDIMLEAELADGKGAPSVKAIQQQINSLRKRLEAIMDRVAARTDKDVFFEQMGVDAMFLDEAHDYKKPPFVTKLDRKIKGISKEVSGRALSALVKLRFIQDGNRGRNTFMATGTPITNTMGEAWLLMNMVAPDVLKEFGVTTFDRFVATFARISTTMEPNAVNKLVRNTRLARFKNGLQLAQFIQSGWDVLLGDALHQQIREYGGGKIPTLEGGKERLIMVPRSKAFDSFARFFLETYDAYKALEGEDKRLYSWIPVVIYGAAKAAAIDVRLVDPTAPDDPGSKLNVMVQGVYDAWVEGTNVDLQVEDQTLTGQNLTQLIFSDVSGRTDTSRLRAFAAGEGVVLEMADEDETEGDGDDDIPVSDNEDRWLYQEIKRKLIEKGIPEDQVQIINDHNKNADTMLAFQDKVSRGEVRIVIGHSDTLGTGVNVQPRLKDIWELDIPMVPAKRDQRKGRMIRSGNLNDTVRATVMAMQRSLDAALMSMNLRKAKASEQALSGKAGAEFDDPYSESLMSMADMEAAMNDDPLFYRQRDLEFQIRNLRLEYEAWEEQKSAERGRLRYNELQIENFNKDSASRTKEADSIDAVLKNEQPILVGESSVKTVADAEKKLTAEFNANSKEISDKTRNSRIKALSAGYEHGEADHVAAEAEYGPVQFTLIYGERPVVVQDDKGNPSTEWQSSSGTIITMNKKVISYTRATKFSTLMEKVREIPPSLREQNKVGSKYIEGLKTENEKLKEFLARPFDSKNELDNLESELSQVNGLMFARDNPHRNQQGHDPSQPVTQANMPTGFELVAPGSLSNILKGIPQKTLDTWNIIAPSGATVGMGATASEAYVNAMKDQDLGGQFPAITAKPAEYPEAQTASSPQTAADKKRAELSALQLMNRQYDKVIKREVGRIFWGRGSTAWTGIPLTPELSKALAGRMLNAVKIGIKNFELFILELRKHHDDQTINGLRPNIMRMWNGSRERHGLDEATDEIFDSAMETAADDDMVAAIAAVNGEEPAEAPPADEPPETQTSPDFSSPESGQYSTKNAFSERAREELGMPERPAVPTLEREPSIEMAKAYGNTKAGSDHIDTLVSELASVPRAVSPFENDLLNFRNAELGNKLRTALQKQIAARKSGNDAEEASAARDAAIYRKEKQELIELVLEPVGTASGRSLQARKAIIDQDFTIDRLAMEYEAAYRKPPSTEQLEAMQKQIDELKAINEALEKSLAESDAKNQDYQKQLEEAHSQRVADVQTPPAPTQPIVESMGERGRNRIKSAKKRIMEMLREGKAFSLPGIVDEAGKAFIELATGYTEIGINTVAGFLKQLKRDFGPSFEKVKEPATAAFKRVIGATSISTDFELEMITSRIDPNDNDSIGRAARALHSYVIRRDDLDASPEGRTAAVDAVYEILVGPVPFITREQTARAMSGIGVYRELSKDEAEVIRRDQKAQLLSLEQIADWKKGQAPPATGQERPPVSDEQRELRRMVNEAKKEAGIVESREGQLKSALDAAKRMTRNRIADLDKAINRTKKPIPGKARILKDDGSPAFAELTKLRAERDELQRQYDEMFGKNTLTDEQRLERAEKALDRAIADLEADLKVGKLYEDAPRPPVTSPAIEAKQAVLDALRANRYEMRLLSGAANSRQPQMVSDAAFERHLKQRDAELAIRLAAKDFAPRPKKPEREYTPEQLRLMLAKQKKEQKLREESRKWVFDNSHPIYKTLMWGPVTGSAIMRKVLTTVDQSLILRQGYSLGTSHPLLYGKAIKKAFASNPLKAWSIFPTEQDLFDTQAALDADAHWVRLEKIAKLVVTDVHGGLNREEGHQSVPEWVNKIPGVGGSERAGSAFINTLRRLVFRSLVDKLSKTMDAKGKSLSAADLRVIGNLVNVATGRVNTKNLAVAVKNTSNLFFSPNWWASRLMWMTGQPMWHESRWFKGEGVSPEVRKLVAMEWGKQAAAQAAIIGLVTGVLYAALGAGGDDEEWDFYWEPSSPNFGRLRINNTVFDMTAGVGQHVSFLYRMMTGKQTDRWETNEVDFGRLVLAYGRGKLAPVPSIAADFGFGKSVRGDKFGSYEWAKRKVLPLSVQDVNESFSGEEPLFATAVSSLMFFGQSAQTYEDRIRARRDTANAIRALRNQGKPQERIDAVLSEHLKYFAAKEAKEALRTAEPDRVDALQKIVDGTESHELSDAIAKEKGDVTLIASELMSTEDKRKADKKSPDDDAGITTARELVKAMAPTYEEANRIYTEAYKRRNGSTTELVGGQFRTKKNVSAARRRLKAMYPK